MSWAEVPFGPTAEPWSDGSLANTRPVASATNGRNHSSAPVATSRSTIQVTTPRGGVVMRKTISRAIRKVPSSTSGASGIGNGNSTAVWPCSITPISGPGEVSSESRRAASYRWTTSLLLTTSTSLGLSLALAVRSVNVVSKAARISPPVPVIPRLRWVRVGSSTSISG